MDTVEEILESLFDYYKVSNVSQLAEKMNTSQARISNWKVRNSVSAIKRQCRELNIYDEVFKSNSSIEENILEEEINNVYEIMIENTKYQLKPKIYLLFNGTINEKIYTFMSKNILLRVLEKLLKEEKTYPIKNAKSFLLEEIKNTDIKFYEKYKLEVLINIIKENLSDLECYTLIKYSEEIFNYKYKNYYFKFFG